MIYPFERVIKLGDDPLWASPDLDHQNWDHSGFTTEVGNYWVRCKIEFPPDIGTFQTPGIQVISTGSFEVFWDGQLIGKNGIVGKSKAEEVPGTFLSRFAIPDSLLEVGDHVVAFRVSNYHELIPGFPSWNIFILEEYKSSQTRDLKLTAKMFILAGVYLMAALYYLFLYVLRKQEQEGLVFSILCFLFCGLLLIEYFKFLYDYLYSFHLIRIIAIYFLTLIITILTPYFFLIYFKIRYKNYLLAIIIIVQILISVRTVPNMDGTNFLLSRVLWWSSLVIILFAVYKRKKEASIILGALLLAGLVIVSHNMRYSAMLFSYDITLFLSFSILVLSIMYLLAQRARAQRLAYESSLLLSSRLQNELLKKNIQPHFIMNTLTSLMGWIEESPKDSVQFIEALSKEFEIMSAIADQKLIPIEQEIALCQHHIEIMKYRKEVDYIFEFKGINPKELVPPAIFHTIIENGITHSYPNEANQIKMVLSFEDSEEYKKYELNVFARNRNKEKQGSGTGFRYIESRLRESFGEAWDLDSYATQEGWRTEIFLHKSSL